MKAQKYLIFCGMSRKAAAFSFIRLGWSIAIRLE
jgi:hypothetical protein